MKIKNILICLLIIIFICDSYSYAQDFEISPAILNFTAEPGQSQSIPITITNHSSTKNSFNVVLKDFIVNKEGDIVVMPPATTENSLVNWLSINPPFLELNPNETRQIIVSIQAPVGDYTSKWSYIYIRNTTEQTALIADKELQTGLILSGQIVVLALQSPKSNINYRMKITGLEETINTNDSIRTFKAKIDNLGDKISECKVTLLATNIETAEEFKLLERNFKSYPSFEFDIELYFPKNALPKGRYALAAILDYGKQSNLEGSQIVIDVK